MIAALPIEYQRKFSFHVYWISHGPLLLRSPKNDLHSTRIDVVFTDVRWIASPVWFDGIRIERGDVSELPIPLTPLIKEEAHFMSAYRIISQGVTHWLLADANVRVAEDDKGWAENSSLLPNFDFRAFTAPLWEKP